VTDHTVKAYDKELDALERGIAVMRAIAEKMVIDAINALSNADLALAHEVVATDVRLDALEREIEDMAVLTIARRQPMAVDLRQLIAAIPWTKPSENADGGEPAPRGALASECRLADFGPFRGDCCTRAIRPSETFPRPLTDGRPRLPSAGRQPRHPIDGTLHLFKRSWTAVAFF
jgi:hypothetical protein